MPRLLFTLKGEEVSEEDETRCVYHQNRGKVHFLANP